MHIYSKVVGEYVDENMLVDNINPDTAVVYRNIEDNMPCKIHLLKEIMKRLFQITASQKY